jgi:predicted RNA-binding Zn-ribbon protein involved in translation (DUF1610 family)
MRLISLLPLAAVLIVGCQSQPKPTHAAAASAPAVIAVLTDQKVIYECPNCGMDYTGPGKCETCDTDLVKTDVAYICPADNEPVERAGACPRCNVNARIVKTAVAADATPNAAPGATGSGAPNGS